MKVLCIGDSNTYGYDPRSYFGSRYPAEVRWTGRLEGHEVLNCGMNGLAVPRTGGPYLELIRSKSPHPMQRGEWVQSDTLIEESEKLRQRYRKLAEERGCFFADAGDWDVELLFDGVHFSPAGHAAFARGLSEALRECESKIG